MVDQPARSLPARPDLRFLKDEAKRRRKAAEFGTLAQAQFTIAREHGFGSWPQLSAFVRTRRLDIVGRAAALVRAACSSDVRTARTLLAAEPDLAGHDLATACVTGDSGVVARILARQPVAATRPTGPYGVPPILYATFSRLLRAEPARAPGIRRAVRLLLDSGADPNTTVDGHEEAPPIYGAAGVTNDPELTAMLLAAGADPDEGLLPPDPDDALAPDRSLLIDAVISGLPARTVEWVVDAGADLGAVDDLGVTALRSAPASARLPSCWRLIADRGRTLARSTPAPTEGVGSRLATGCRAAVGPATSPQWSGANRTHLRRFCPLRIVIMGLLRDSAPSMPRKAHDH